MPGPSTMLSLRMPLKSSIAVHTVLHTVTLLGALCVIPLVHSANQVAGDAADALKADALTHFFISALNSHSKFLLIGVIASPCAHWRGNLLLKRGFPRVLMHPRNDRFFLLWFFVLCVIIVYHNLERNE